MRSLVDASRHDTSFAYTLHCIASETMLLSSLVVTAPLKYYQVMQ